MPDDLIVIPQDDINKNISVDLGIPDQPIVVVPMGDPNALLEIEEQFLAFLGIASKTKYGMVRIGEGIEVINGVISVAAYSVDGFVKANLSYLETQDLNSGDKLYVFKDGEPKFITAEKMLGGIESNIHALNYEASVGVNTSDPSSFARTWFMPIDSIVGNTIPTIEIPELKTMNFDDTEEVNLEVLNIELLNESSPGFSSDELSLNSVLETGNEQVLAENFDTEINDNTGIDSPIELQPGFI